MLLTAAYSMSPQPYVPYSSSPLSSRSANVNAAFLPSQSLFAGMTDSENNSTNTPKSVAYAQRQARPTAFTSRTRDEQRERRRDLFLKRVHQTRDDKRWEGRREEILRSDHFAQQKRWKQRFENQPQPDIDTMVAQSVEPTAMQLSRPQAASISNPSGFQTYSEFPLDEVDIVARQEQLEIQEWAEFLAQPNPSHTRPQSESRLDIKNHSQSTEYDDDGYDLAFMEIIDQEPPGHMQPSTDTDMDLSS